MERRSEADYKYQIQIFNFDRNINFAAQKFNIGVLTINLLFY
jgi:hypothetical protein